MRYTNPHLPYLTYLHCVARLSAIDAQRIQKCLSYLLAAAAAASVDIMTTARLTQLRDLVIALSAVNEPHDWTNELEMTAHDGFTSTGQQPRHMRTRN